jgi:polyphenol oxidase
LPEKPGFRGQGVFLNLLRFYFPGTDNVKCAFGTRLGGVSEGRFGSNNVSFEVGDHPENVLINREAIKKELEFNRLIELRQVHSSDLHFEVGGDFIAGTEIEGDGAALSSPGASVMIKTADCQPVFMVHESGKYALGLHVGWRGNRDNFPGIGVKNFCDFYKISPKKVMVVRGPSLGPCCSRFDIFEEHWSPDFYRYYREKTRTMDLWSLTRDQLILSGIPRENIFSIDLCTRCLAGLFFSYRLDKKCGRQGSFIGLIK